MIKWRSLIVVLLFFSACTSSEKTATKIKWKHVFSKLTFEQAKKEEKFVLLTLEANWCHWCHVMEDSTYSNPEVISFLNENFICVSVDQDAHPELASRYRKYGWPATIVLNADGEELLKKAGFMSPESYISELKNAISNGKNTEKNNLSQKISSKEEFQERLKSNFDKYLNFKNGGFKSAMKYIEEESFEYALFMKKM